jgi:hypothetical protein
MTDDDKKPINHPKNQVRACGMVWPVCPDCLGEPLVSSAGLSRCPRCRRRFAEDDRVPCPDQATAMLIDSGGAGGRMCRSHAVRGHAMVIGSRVEGLDRAALAIVATLPERDKETAAIRAADHVREVAELEGQLAPIDPERRAEIDAFVRGTHPAFRAYGLSPDEAASIVKHGRGKRDDEDE